MKGSDQVGASDTTGRPSPFLRWAGSKRWLLPIIADLIPQDFNRYYEPFLGSGSVFFSFAAGHPALLSDVIHPLIGCYNVVRDNPLGISKKISEWPVNSEAYYQIRSKQFESGTLDAAARFIYLNRYCYNGLYRENSSGLFNVPFGRPKNTNAIPVGNLVACSARLRNRVELKVADFEDALEDVRDGDLVYLDPPYVAGHRSNGFVDYNAKIFSWDDQRRLASVFHKVDSMGAYVISTNANHDSVSALYHKFARLPISRYSSMSGKLAGRGASAELIILGSRLTRGNSDRTDFSDSIRYPR
ncbi:DNA adenine methylase [Mycolicibacterium pulveris]|uniref:DNA adenine methylase n=1 Tax=Mycolicibacterium pulveris TaxID=36813 RepID=UPI003CEF2FD9